MTTMGMIFKMITEQDSVTGLYLGLMLLIYSTVAPDFSTTLTIINTAVPSTSVHVPNLVNRRVMKNNFKMIMIQKTISKIFRFKKSDLLSEESNAEIV
jgi:hypothetical protein